MMAEKVRVRVRVKEGAQRTDTGAGPWLLVIGGGEHTAGMARDGRVVYRSDYRPAPLETGRCRYRGDLRSYLLGCTRGYCTRYYLLSKPMPMTIITCVGCVPRRLPRDIATPQRSLGGMSTSEMFSYFGNVQCLETAGSDTRHTTEQCLSPFQQRALMLSWFRSLRSP